MPLHIVVIIFGVFLVGSLVLYSRSDGYHKFHRKVKKEKESRVLLGKSHIFRFRQRERVGILVLVTYYIFTLCSEGLAFVIFLSLLPFGIVLGLLWVFQGDI